MKKPIELQKFMGVWYEIARLPYDMEEGVYNCKAEYTLKPNHISVMNSGVYGNKNKKYTWAAKLKPIPNTTNEFTLTGDGNKKGIYKILYISEDYAYSVVASGNGVVWVLSRTKEISDEEYRKLQCVVSIHGYNSKSLLKTKQI